MKNKTIEACIGCPKIENNYCLVYNNPATQHYAGGCYFLESTRTIEVKKIKINPLKKSKRGG